MFSTQAIVFDFGGVIARSIDHASLADFIAESFDIRDKELQNVLWAHKRWLAEEKGEQAYWVYYADSRGRILPNEWFENLNRAKVKSLLLDEEMLSLVYELQAQGYQTPLLSNVEESRGEFLKGTRHYTHFEPVLLSYEIGYEKPDQRIYAHLLDTLKLPKETCLFVDDKQENIAGAQACGIESVHFKDPKQLKAELRKRQIISF